MENKHLIHSEDTGSAHPRSLDTSGRTGKDRDTMTPAQEGLLFRVEAAAVLLGIGRTTMYELIKGGEIPVVRIGRRTSCTAPT
jgi:excisionase family DNA binding protein